MNNLPTYLGAKESPSDIRQVHYEDIIFGVPLVIPRKYNVEEKYGKVARVDQGSSLSCVSQGGTRYKEVKDQKETGKFIQLSARFIYSQYYLTNGAMYVRDVMKCLQKYGVAEEKVFPTLRQGQSITEDWMRYSGDLDDKVYKNAETYKIKSYADISTKNPEVIARAIYENDGVILGIRPTGGNMGHLIYWTGYDLTAQTFDILDSYSPQDKKVYYTNNKFYYNGPNYQIDIFDLFTCVDLNNQTLSDLKNLMLLRRDPSNSKDVYALNNDAKHLITNKQSLIEGAKSPDPMWLWDEGCGITIATPKEWEAEESYEITLSPPDYTFSQKAGASLKSIIDWIKRLFGIK